MTRGKALSQDLCWVVMQMYHALAVTEIMHYTGLKCCTIEQVLSIIEAQVGSGLGDMRDDDLWLEKIVF
jgi:hypothetical protein